MATLEYLGLRKTQMPWYVKLRRRVVGAWRNFRFNWNRWVYSKMLLP